MKILRTPDERFGDLPGYNFATNYIDVEGIRIHYVDEGPSEAPPVLMLHGEPSWSYLYRKMIPIFANAGFRAIAPDLVGFGKSDKLAKIEEYTYQKHVDWIRGWMHTLKLSKITLICQDWGALIGLRLAAEHPDRFARIVVANGFLPAGDRRMPMAFTVWKAFALHTPWFPVGAIVNLGTVMKLSGEIKAAYNAPFPNESYKKGARAFPKLVPTKPNDPAAPANRAAWEVLKKWEKPFLTAFGDSDPIMRGADRVFQKLVPGAKGQSHTIIKGAGHFLQEDKGERLAQIALDFIAKT